MMHTFSYLISILWMIAWIFLSGCDSSESTGAPTDGTDTADTDTSPFGGEDTRFSDDSTETTTAHRFDTLFPHTVGNWWIYRYEYEDEYVSGCAPGEWTARLADMSVVDGKETYQYTNPCVFDEIQRTYSLQFDGDQVILVDFEDPYFMLDEPVEDGAVWETALDGNPYSYTWESVGSVTVPAGTFDDCWKRVDMNTQQYLTYCRGIGRVSGGEEGVMTADLIDYHLETP